MYTYLALLAWLYVALMASVAEAGSTGGSLLGAFITFMFYGLLPVGILGYILLTPARKRALRAREAAEQAQAAAAADGASASAPDAGGQPTADPVAPMRKEP